MATANDLLQTLHAFTTASSPYNLTFFGSLTSGSGNVLIRPYTYPTETTRVPNSIILPNGSKYDPWQTYDAPLTPKTLSYSVILKPATAGSENTEAAITGYYNSFSVQFVGLRGTLNGASYGIVSGPTATARLLQAKMVWDLPRQIPTAIGGEGSATPGIKTAVITYTFDLLTTWDYTY